MMDIQKASASDNGNHAITESIDINKLSKEYPLRKIHYLWLFMQSILGPYYSAQRFTLYFLFSHTSAGCSIKHDLALMYMISIFCETLVIPLTGYICDKFKRFNHIILVFTVLINLILGVALYIIFIAKWSQSKWLLMAINIVQTLVSMQLNNSLYKLTKIFIDEDTVHIDCTDVAGFNCNNIQTSYFTRIGVWSRFVQQIWMFIMVIPLFVFMKGKYLSFDTVQALLVTVVIIYGIIAVVLSIKIYKLFDTNKRLYGMQKKDDEYLIKSVNKSLSVSQSNDNSGTASSLYFCHSFKLLFIDNKMTRYGIINVILVFLLADLMSSYEPLTIAGVDTNSDNETLSNFCGNYLTNLVYQSVWSSLFTGIGAVLYIYVLLPFVDTYHFYRYVYPISSILVAGAIFVISGFDSNISQTWLSISLGFLMAFFTYAHQFDDFLNLGYMNKEAVGFYQIVYAWSNNVWKIFGYLFIYLNVMNIAVASMIGILLVSSVIQSLFFSRLFIPKPKDASI